MPQLKAYEVERLIQMAEKGQLLDSQSIITAIGEYDIEIQKIIKNLEKRLKKVESLIDKLSKFIDTLQN